MTAATHHAGPPDWSSIAEDILCPLCEYNLRGVQEPRCPECGYTCSWSELIDPALRLHPYLFEHHPEQNVWSFRKTLTGALLPRRFWRVLHPTQPSNCRRLIIYWLLTAATWIVLGLASLGCLWVRDLRSRLVAPAVRAEMASWAADPWHQQLITQSYGSMGAYLDYSYPLAFDARTLWNYARVRSEDLLWVPILLVWPWQTFVTLMIFQSSMRRACVRPIHVLRCVIYSFSTAVWVALIACLLTAAIVIMQAYGLGSVPGIRLAPVTLSAFLMLATIYHLITAYRRYLRFDHPLATVLASQVIGILALFSVSVLLAGLL